MNITIEGVGAKDLCSIVDNHIDYVNGRRKRVLASDGSSVYGDGARKAGAVLDKADEHLRNGNLGLAIKASLRADGLVTDSEKMRSELNAYVV